MNVNHQSIHPSVQAAAELELADWQQMLEQLNESSGDEVSIRFVERQITRLKIDMGIEPPADTHVRSETHGDEAAFVIPEHEAGLTKREYMATTLLAGLLAKTGAYYNAKEVCAHAVDHADALIEVLNQ